MGFIFIFTSDIPMKCSIIRILFYGKQQLCPYTFKPFLVVFGWNVDFSIQNKVGCFLKWCKLNW